jgi:hypothetical protein
MVPGSTQLLERGCGSSTTNGRTKRGSRHIGKREQWDSARLSLEQPTFMGTIAMPSGGWMPHDLNCLVRP